MDCTWANIAGESGIGSDEAGESDYPVQQQTEAGLHQADWGPCYRRLPFDLLQALDVKLLPDLQYALKLANATSNKITANCYSAWIDIIQVQQTAVQDASGTAITVPTPHIITDFERLVEIRNMLQPDSPFMTACSPVANMVKVDVTNFIGLVVGGGASLSALVPGL